MSKTREWFEKQGCRLPSVDLRLWQEIFTLWQELFPESQGGPCNWCFLKDECPVRQLVDEQPQRSSQEEQVRVLETNAEIAQRLGISSRQASKLRRRSGELS